MFQVLGDDALGVGECILGQCEGDTVLGLILAVLVAVPFKADHAQFQYSTSMVNMPYVNMASGLLSCAECLVALFVVGIFTILLGKRIFTVRGGQIDQFYERPPVFGQLKARHIEPLLELRD